MPTDGRALYGVLGCPVTHSLSPVMHQAAFDSLGIAAEYRAFEVQPGELDQFLKVTARHTLCGLNVTIPYKESILPLLDYVSPESRLAGSVNTVKIKAARLEGFTTDGRGFLADLEENGFSPRGAEVCVLGAGGASRAVCFALAGAGAGTIGIFNRDARKAGRLAEQVRAAFPAVTVVQAGTVEALGIGEARLLVNATSVGMKPEDRPLVDGRFLHPGLFVYDLVYAPGGTQLLAAARQTGCRTANGLGMLLHQGMLSFEIWTGIKPPRGIMEQALREAAQA
jgi:shikimate dehydrogenase